VNSLFKKPAFLGDNLREVVAHASTAFAVKILAAILSLSLSIALARLLGATDTGHYYLIFTIVTIAALLARSGIDRAGLRFVAASKAADRPADIAHAHKLSVILVATIGSIATVTLASGANFLAADVFSAEALAPLVAIAALAVVPIALSNLYSELLKGLKRTGVAIAVQSAWLPALTLIGVAIAVPRYGLRGAVIAMLIGSCLTLVTAILYWLRLSPRTTGEKTLNFDELVSASRPLFWVGVFQLVIAHSATIVLGIFHSASEIGRFAVATRTSALISFVLFAVNSIAAPKFAELYRQNRLADLQATAIQSAALMAVMALPLLMVFLFFPGSIMGIFGPEFTGAALVLAVLSIGQFINVVTGSVGYLLAMTGHGKPLRNTLAVSAVIHVTICFAVVPNFGAVGAAIVTALTMTFINARLAYCVWQRLEIVSLPFLGSFLEKRRI
jgi:O-antigen/teichoic acid export membrane protein